MTYQDEKLTERLVTYTLEYEGKFYIVEDVPARVNEETGEQFFSPATVECLQKTIKGKSKPSKMIETPCLSIHKVDGKKTQSISCNLRLARSNVENRL